ncbi:MAG TPA: DUF349 domain-containing protein [Candidatus Polarisedimenticolia bacterium]|nr:DUF349 domain-containing protein [Candidatus Polarisedimenticolia bacterium]
MGFLDRFRPPGGLAHPEADERLHAVERLATADLGLLEPVARGDADARVRRAATRRLRDPRVLAEVAKADADPAVREAAAASLLARALGARDEGDGLPALEGLEDPRQLTAVARSAALESVAGRALERLADERGLAGVARHGEHAAVRLAAVARIESPTELSHIALRGEHRDTCLAALERIDDPELLETIALRARLKPIARKARGRLRGPDGEDGAAETERPQSDRAAQEHLIAAVDALGEDGEWEDVPSRLQALRDAWIEDLAAVDDDLDERFRERCHAARQRLLGMQEERAERERRERDLEERLGPRRRLCEAVEGATSDSVAAVLQEARAAWASLPPAEGPEAEGLDARFLAACAAIESGQAQREAEAKARTERDEAARQSEAALQKRRESLKVLEKMAATCEALAKKEDASLAKLERALRDLRTALQEIPPLPTPKDHETIVRRLKGLQADLTPRLQTLRDTDRWQRWANAAVQEELCARMEDLASAVEAEGADLSAAGSGMRELMERWRAAGPAPPDRSLSLWNRFKAARDRVREKADDHFQKQIEEAGVNLKTKEALCEKAEVLAVSNDWIKTAEAVKALQLEWKGIGPVSRGHEKAIWERFRKACDQFFKARDEDLAKRKGEWAKHLESKVALCEKAEALAGSTDWKATAEEFKRLQAEWKTTGPVRRNQSEVIWNRFRTACDRFFERFKNRDAVERDALVKERLALCAEIEALAPAPETPALSVETVPSAADAVPDPAAETSAALDGTPDAGAATEAQATGLASPEAAAAPAEEPVAPPPAPPASPEEMVGRLRAGLERWRRMRGLPPDQMGPLNTRFFAAFDRALKAHPQAFHGTSLDAEANLKRAQDLVAKVQRLAPSSNGPDTSSLTPGERLASMWREALATNTMGGRIADESRARAAAEEARKAQAAWQRLGYVPEPERRTLQADFDTACRAIFAARGADGPTGPEGRDRGRGGDGRPRGGPGRGDGRPRGGGPGGGGPGGGGRPQGRPRDLQAGSRSSGAKS